MNFAFKALGLAVFALTISASAYADTNKLAGVVVGKADAPVKVDEYVSLTCGHCAEFYTKTLPTIEKRYIETGKVRFVLHDFPLDGASLKASAIARCMPADQYLPFVKTLFASQASWAFGNGKPEDNLIQIAKLGGLAEDKARACANDSKLQDAIIAERTEASEKFKVNATPTFVLNDGLETINGALDEKAFAATFDRLLAAKK